MKQNTRKNVESTIDSQRQQKENGEDLKILWTSILLVGWTFIGWTPMLLVMIGVATSIYWDMVGSAMIIVTVGGDSIILLIYDGRWKASLQDMEMKILTIFSQSNMR